MALRVADVPADVERSQPAIRLAADRQLEVRRLAGTFLAVAIEGERLVKRRDEIGPPPQDLVVDRCGARDAARPAGLRGAQAEQADDVRPIAMEAERLARAVEADGRIAALETRIAHVPEQIAGRVLRDGAAEMEAESPIRERSVLLAVPLHRHAAHEHEAAPAVERIEPALRRSRENSERKISRVRAARAICRSRARARPRGRGRRFPRPRAHGPNRAAVPSRDPIHAESVFDACIPMLVIASPRTRSDHCATCRAARRSIACGQALRRNQRAAELLQPFQAEPVVDPGRAALALQQTRVGEHLEVVAHRRLAQPERLGQIAHARLAAGLRGEEAQQAQPAGIAQGSEQRGQLRRFGRFEPAGQDGSATGSRGLVESACINIDRYRWIAQHRHSSI